jgi:hypothetical protein
MAEVADYPTRLEVDYPEDQRHGFPLIGWWLAGIPQYAIGALLAGAAFGTRTPTGGVIDALMVVVAILLLVGRGYPRPVFDIAMGFQRWALRAGVYALGMTREYPPFRVDPGPREPSDGPPQLPAPPASQPTA